MSRIDHAAEAKAILTKLTKPGVTDGMTGSAVIASVISAQVHATLALVEQQRIANLIDLYHQHADRETREALWTIEEGDRWSLRPEIASALGIGGGSDG